MANIPRINQYLKSRLCQEGILEIRVIDAAKWLDEQGILMDLSSRLDLPLRELLVMLNGI
ncbi:MAG: hypothetical protein OXF20_10690 [Gammaproteobacteria bacterium]|nr:hypothetical protein [Gammaproteobacteria bacterium]